MIFAWIKQFLMCTGFFAIVLAGQTVNLALKEKRFAEKALDVAPQTARVTIAAHSHIN